jgi:hypothetical protein
VTKLLRDLGIKSPRMPDFKEASRVLHEKGIEARRSNGKKIFDLRYNKADINEYVSNLYDKFSD